MSLGFVYVRSTFDDVCVVDTGVLKDVYVRSTFDDVCVADTGGLKDVYVRSTYAMKLLPNLLAP